MEQNKCSRMLPVQQVKIEDAFWKEKQRLVREEVIPYQWKALNDQIPGAAPSFCMHNFRAAVHLNNRREQQKENFHPPVYSYRGFERLPENPGELKDEFYGFVFQDSDFYKWIEAVGYSLIQHPDAELEATADEAIEIVAAAQQPNGYLDTYYILNGQDQIFTNLRDFHELYCLGHLIEGAIAYYQATGKDRLLQVACRYADYAASKLGDGEGKKRGYPGHEIAEMALLQLYEVTGEPRYLELSRFFINERGRRPYYFDSEHPEDIKPGDDSIRYSYHQAHLPVREQTEAVGHAVRAVYLYAGMAELARIDRDDSLLQACRTLWDSITQRKMYITGGIGGTHIGESFSFDYDLPSDTAYAETCASIGLIFFAGRMLQLEADAKYADVMETALYNGVLSGMALDGKSFFYVNPLAVDPVACHKDERKAHVQPVRQKWFGCACCPPNLARLIGSIGRYAYTASEDTLYLHLYIGSDLKLSTPEGEVHVQLRSHFPYNGTVSIRVSGEGAASGKWSLALRIPGWCREYKSCGISLDDARLENGYLYITRAWKEDEFLELDFVMNIRLMQSNPLVRETAGQIAVTRGPVVYCLEERDNGKNLHLLALSANAKAHIEPFSIEGEKFPAVVAIGWKETEEPDQAGRLYRTARPVEYEPVELKFVPYYTWANRGENEMTVWVRRRDL